LRIYIFSLFYRISRQLITQCLYFFQFIFSKQKNLEPAVKFGDKILSSISIIGNVVYDFHLPYEKSITIYNLTFPSPLIGASFKSDQKILEMWLRMGLGGLIFKTIMKNQQTGNPIPRLQDATLNGEKGLFNSLGLPGPGISKFIDELNESNLWTYNRPIGISIGGVNKNEYVENISNIEKRIQGMDINYFYELNISCPNIENGKTISENLSEFENLLEEINKIIPQVISIKVSPDSNDQSLINIAEICRDFDRIIINAGNTQFKTPEEVGIQSSNFSMSGGGLSGPSIFKRTLSMVSIFSKFDLPIIATGGISSINHLIAAKESGASLFGMATSLVFDPYCIPRINNKL